MRSSTDFCDVGKGSREDGKPIRSGYSYWGIEPVIAWQHACHDPYPVMKDGIDSFGQRWQNAQPALGTSPFTMSASDSDTLVHELHDALHAVDVPIHRLRTSIPVLLTVGTHPVVIASCRRQ